MSITDKIKNEAEHLIGKGKEAVGHLRNDEHQQAGGQVDQAEASAKQAGEHAKDTVKDVKDSAKDIL